MPGATKRAAIVPDRWSQMPGDGFFYLLGSCGIFKEAAVVGVVVSLEDAGRFTTMRSFPVTGSGSIIGPIVKRPATASISGGTLIIGACSYSTAEGFGFVFSIGLLQGLHV